jgi:hypothetical protein
MGTSNKLLFWWNQCKADFRHTGWRQILNNIIRFRYRYIKNSEKKSCITASALHWILITYPLSISILTANLPSLLDNKDTSPFKHESVTSFMLDAHLKCDDYKYYRSCTENKTSFKCLGQRIFLFFSFLGGSILQYKFPTNIMYHYFNTKEPENITKIK